ncbi:hypothetical protein [Neobacillus sp. 204]|uniref:hypothetical protein n=1 Tax=Neobacillus sp. 204 TaxID=3383351 RepID=UPI00397E1316
MQFEDDRKKKEGSRPNSLLMFCECCETQWDRWDIDVVEPDEKVFGVNKLLKDFDEEEAAFNFACPVCVTRYNLKPVQTEQANKFRYRNEKLKEVVLGVMIQ